MPETQYPLILVFYVARDVITQREIMQNFIESVNLLIESKQLNALAFFVPTDGEERIECLNPKLIHEPEMEKINQMISDIKEAFSVGVDIDVPDEEITLDENPCGCGGNCQCNKIEL